MSGMFGGGSKGATKISSIRVTQSKQGSPVPVVMGTQRIQQALVWMGGFTATKESQGGKGIGGGKGGTFYLYTADVLAALCAGPVASIGNVWCGQTWLNNTGSLETVTVTAVYAPNFAALLIADNGVSLANTYSQSYTDYGAPAATVLSGTDLASLIQVPYGTSLTTGHYSVNPASIGTFVISSVANASGGNTVYNGTFTGGASPYASGASNAWENFAFDVEGFANPLNDGTFLCVASSATQITLNNPNGVAETHAATAKELGNTYHFAAADIGKTAQIAYQFKLQYLINEELDLIPAGKTIIVGEPFVNGVDLGVTYYNPGGPNDGVALTPTATNPPTVTGTYHFTSSGNSANGSTYKFATGDIASEVRIKYGYEDDEIVGPDAPTTLNFELIGGGQSQAPWSLLTSTFPGAALGYTKIALIAYGPMALGESAEVQDNTFEVITPDAFGGGILDCNPVQCILRVLTDNTWGVPFPVAAIDNGASGTWGGPSSTPGARSTAGTAFNWFAAQSYFISPILDQQSTAASHIEKWLEAGMCAAFMSEGLLKLVPYGDTSAAGNGCTWSAPQFFIVALDDECFLGKEGEDKVKLSREAWQDAYNEVQIQWANRANQYAPEVTPDFDQSSIDRFGLRIEDPQDWDFITTLQAAKFAANMRVKRGVNIRNTYEFTLPFYYSYLEPMDIVTISTTSIWAAGLNNVNLGIVDLPVRITKIVDDPINGLEITAEDYPWGTHQPVLFNKGISAGDVIVDAFADPGNSEVVMFEAFDRLTGFAGNEIWIGATGGKNWGSCNVLVSQDGTKYEQVGTVTARARLGVLNGTFASGTDPDTTNALVIDLVDNSPALESGTTTDADSGNTLCFVDEEIIAYSAATVTGADQYTMDTYIRRGLMGTPIASHAIDSLFMRLDDAVFKFTYDPTWAGQTLYFKFQSVNSFGNRAQDQTFLKAVTFTVPGVNGGAVDASSGLVLVTNPPGFPAPGPPIGRGPLGWNPLTNLVKWVAQAIAGSPWWAILNDTVNNFSFSITGGSPNTLTPNAAIVGSIVKGNTAAQNATAQSGGTFTQPTKLINGNGSTADGNQAGSNSGTGTITLSHFGFSVPADATITGVVAQWTAGAEPGGTGSIDTALTAGGGTTKTTSVPRNYVLYTLGGITDLWGGSLSPSDVNATGFGFTLTNTADQTWIFNGKMTVYYTTVSGQTWAQSQTFAGASSSAKFLGTPHTIIGQEAVEFSTAVSCHYSSLSGDGGYMHIGLTTGASFTNMSDSYIAFFAIKNASSNWENWQLLICDGVHTELQVDSGVPVLDGIRTELGFTVSADGSLISFLIDGVTVSTATTNIPTASLGLCFAYSDSSGNLAFRLEGLTLNY